MRGSEGTGLRAQLWARNIRLNRTRNGWSQDYLAAQLDVTRQAVARWESGKPPRLNHCFDLAAVLNVPFETLFPMVDDRFR